MRDKTVPKEILDQQRIRELLHAADDRWYAGHPSQYQYQEYLDFVAAYIAKHYHREKKHLLVAKQGKESQSHEVTRKGG